jgi:hypothetical protein
MQVLTGFSYPLTLQVVNNNYIHNLTTTDSRPGIPIPLRDVDEPAQIMEGAPEGSAPEIINSPNLDQSLREAAKKVRAWCTSGVVDRSIRKWRFCSQGTHRASGVKISKLYLLPGSLNHGVKTRGC